jgi:N-hydroxyarylamine O-acetyltransferase
MNEKIENYIANLKSELKSSDDINQIYNNYINFYLSENSFNNIAVLTKRPGDLLNLDLNFLYEKIIVNKKGGYCFEHNKLVYELFKSAGAVIESKLARVVYNKKIDAGRTHRMNIVIINSQQYLFDVGFGGYTPDSLIPLSGGIVKTALGRSYRIVEQENQVFELQVMKAGDFFVLYTFDLLSYQESDFNIANFYTSNHPKAKFVTEIVLTKFTDVGVKVISGGEYFKLSENDEGKTRIDSKEKLKSILQNEFLIETTKEELSQLASYLG